MSDPFILSRLLKLKSANEDQVQDLWVRFSRPEQTAPRSLDGDIDTRVEIRIESNSFRGSDYATGGDDVSALLGALIVAKAQLDRLQREGHTVWWMEPGDLDDARFWGYQVHF